MFVNTDSIFEKNIQSDICIVGAGAAGITLALEMAKHKINIVLIESGDFEVDKKTQSLYEGFNIGKDYSLTETRARFLGGTTNWWGGMCHPLHEVDFEPKEYCPNYDGWPIQRSELDEYYKKAHHYLDLDDDDYDYSIDKCREYSKINKKGFLEGSENIEGQMFMMSRGPTNYRSKFSEKLSKSDNITVFTNLNVINISTLEGSVNYVEAVMGGGGRVVKFKSANFVIAMGGIETPRLLLNSNNEYKDGIGNKNDLVGRFFMEHPHSECAELHLNPDVIMDDFLDTGTWVPNKISKYPEAMWPLYSINKKEIKQRKILNASFTTIRPDTKDSYNQFSDNSVTVEVTKLMKKLFNSVNDNNLVNKVAIMARTEQAPNPNSRITLSKERDFLGQRKVVLNWELLKIDIDTIFKSLYVVNNELIKKKIGRIKLNSDNEFNIFGGHHHMGTTKMHNNEKLGVVDSNLKLHELNNLYVASSSVFPTSGFANPTLTIVALSIRLSEYLLRNKYAKA